MFAERPERDSQTPFVMHYGNSSSFPRLVHGLVTLNVFSSGHGQVCSVWFDALTRQRRIFWKVSGENERDVSFQNPSLIVKYFSIVLLDEDEDESRHNEQSFLLKLHVHTKVSSLLGSVLDYSHTEKLSLRPWQTHSRIQYTASLEGFVLTRESGEMFNILR